jgi:hypothetical protein
MIKHLTSAVAQSLDDSGSEIAESVARVGEQKVSNGEKPEFERFQSIEKIDLVEMLIGTLWCVWSHSLTCPSSLLLR